MCRFSHLSIGRTYIIDGNPTCIGCENETSIPETRAIYKGHQVSSQGIFGDYFLLRTPAHCTVCKIEIWGWVVQCEDYSIELPLKIELPILESAPSNAAAFGSLLEKI